MTAAEPNEIGFRGKFREMQTKFWEEHTKVPSGLVDVVRMVKCSTTLKEQLRESNLMLQKTLSEFRAAASAVL